MRSRREGVSPTTGTAPTVSTRSKVAILTTIAIVMLAVAVNYARLAANQHRSGGGETTQVRSIVAAGHTATPPALDDRGTPVADQSLEAQEEPAKKGATPGGSESPDPVDRSTEQLAELPGPQAGNANDRSPRNESTPAGILVRSTALGALYGRVLRASLSGDGATQPLGNLECERVYAAAGHGLCLIARRRVITSYEVAIFDDDGRIRATLPLSGSPSRTRVSPDGKRGAVTVFTSGHSYSGGAFSTQTSLFDLDAGTLLVNDLEKFEVTRDGQRIESPDFNFWGVTFATDSNRFYATLGTGGAFLLVEGNVAERRMRVIYDGVECPSLSPDGARIAFKKRITESGRLRWQPAVLDLSSMRELLLPEFRSVDDQIDWLDNRTVLYALPESIGADSVRVDIWALSADGAAPPRVLVQNAESPATLR